MAIHHIDVNPIGARGLDRAHLIAKLGEVGRKN